MDNKKKTWNLNKSTWQSALLRWQCACLLLLISSDAAINRFWGVSLTSGPWPQPGQIWPQRECGRSQERETGWDCEGEESRTGERREQLRGLVASLYWLPALMSTVLRTLRLAGSGLFSSSIFSPSSSSSSSSSSSLLLSKVRALWGHVCVRPGLIPARPS